MKTNNIQFNAKTFKATRDIINAYFECLDNLSITLDKCKESADNYAKCIATDKEQLAKLMLGDSDGIVRSADEIKASLDSNVQTYNKLMKPYNELSELCEKTKEKGVALFDKKDSALYKAYADYALNPSTETYDAYAKALADRFIALGLTDATVDNVQHYMVNADKEKRGKSAVRVGRTIDALTPKEFSKALLRKIHSNNKSSFDHSKFIKYCESVKAKANAK